MPRATPPLPRPSAWRQSPEQGEGGREGGGGGREGGPRDEKRDEREEGGREGGRGGGKAWAIDNLNEPRSVAKS